MHGGTDPRGDRLGYQKHRDHPGRGLVFHGPVGLFVRGNFSIPNTQGATAASSSSIGWRTARPNDSTRGRDRCGSRHEPTGQENGSGRHEILSRRPVARSTLHGDTRYLTSRSEGRFPPPRSRCEPPTFHVRAGRWARAERLCRSPWTAAPLRLGHGALPAYARCPRGYRTSRVYCELADDGSFPILRRSKRWQMRATRLRSAAADAHRATLKGEAAVLHAGRCSNVARGHDAGRGGPRACAGRTAGGDALWSATHRVEGGAPMRVWLQTCAPWRTFRSAVSAPTGVRAGGRLDQARGGLKSRDGPLERALRRDHPRSREIPAGEHQDQFRRLTRAGAGT